MSIGYRWLQYLIDSLKFVNVIICALMNDMDSQDFFNYSLYFCFYFVKTFPWMGTQCALKFATLHPYIWQVGVLPFSLGDMNDTIRTHFVAIYCSLRNILECICQHSFPYVCKRMHMLWKQNILMFFFFTLTFLP